ncbi:hypothetical protein ACLOJK_032341 [Asimina triloba]
MRDFPPATPPCGHGHANCQIQPGPCGLPFHVGRMSLLTLKLPNTSHKSSPHPRFAPLRLTTHNSNAHFPPFSSSCKNCKTVAVSLSISTTNSHKVSEPRLDEEKGVSKVADVATLGNLCVDIVINVPSLPPASPVERKAYMEQLSASRPDKKYWEAGGNCNLAIAAARLGLHCFSLGHVGDEIYGHFLLDVLKEEGIAMVGMDEDTEAATGSSYETLLCWVLVDPLQRHGFCSRADFRKEPAFSWMNKLTGKVKMAIKQSKILFCNGYVFDELSPDLILSAMDCAIDVGTVVFFDPGPRGKTLLCGTLEQQNAMKRFLRMSDVLLLTVDENAVPSVVLLIYLRGFLVVLIVSVMMAGVFESCFGGFWLGCQLLLLDIGPLESFLGGSLLKINGVHCWPGVWPMVKAGDGKKEAWAEALTGIANPITAGKELIINGLRTKWVIIKMGPKGSMLITTSSIYCAPAFKVDVVDTVGCGDSFTAAVVFGFLHGMPYIDTLALANAVGAATAMGSGAGRNVANLDKILMLLRSSNLNEDEKLWNMLADENPDEAEIVILSGTINGCSNRLARVAIQKIVSELLPKLESIHDRTCLLDGETTSAKTFLKLKIILASVNGIAVDGKAILPDARGFLNNNHSEVSKKIQIQEIDFQLEILCLCFVTLALTEIVCWSSSAASFTWLKSRNSCKSVTDFSRIMFAGQLICTTFSNLRNFDGAPAAGIKG